MVVCHADAGRAGYVVDGEGGGGVICGGMRGVLDGEAAVAHESAG